MRPFSKLGEVAPFFFSAHVCWPGALVAFFEACFNWIWVELLWINCCNEYYKGTVVFSMLFPSPLGILRDAQSPRLSIALQLTIAQRGLRRLKNPLPSCARRCFFWLCASVADGTWGGDDGLWSHPRNLREKHRKTGPVNVYQKRTGKIQHFQWENPLFRLGHFFNSYVTVITRWFSHISRC